MYAVVRETTTDQGTEDEDKTFDVFLFDDDHISSGHDKAEKWVLETEIQPGVLYALMPLKNVLNPGGGPRFHS